MSFLGMGDNGGKKAAKKAAKAQEEAEAKRLAGVTAGKAAIDSAFKGFDDGYYQKITDEYNGHYAPQMEADSSRARKRLILQQAGRGVLESSAGGDELGRFQQAADNQRTDVANQALDAANQRKQAVASNKRALYNDNYQAADPAQAGRSAADAVGAIDVAQNYNPLIDVFSSFINSTAQAQQAQNQGYGGFGYGRNSRKSSRVVS